MTAWAEDKRTSKDKVELLTGRCYALEEERTSHTA